MKKFEEAIVSRYLDKDKPKGIIKKEFPLIPYAKSGNVEKNLERVKSKRIDLLIERDKEIEIYEVKPRLNADALGKLLIYRYLYKINHMRTYGTRKKIYLKVLCEEIDFEIEPLFDVFGIEVIVV